MHAGRGGAHSQDRSLKAVGMIGPLAPRRRTPGTSRPDRHGHSAPERRRGSGCRRPTSGSPAADGANGERGCPERGPARKGEGEGRVPAGRAQGEDHRADKHGPSPDGSLDTFGERQRGCRHARTGVSAQCRPPPSRRSYQPRSRKQDARSTGRLRESLSWCRIPSPETATGLEAPDGSSRAEAWSPPGRPGERGWPSRLEKRRPGWDSG